MGHTGVHAATIVPSHSQGMFVTENSNKQTQGRNGGIFWSDGSYFFYLICKGLVHVKLCRWQLVCGCHDPQRQRHQRCACVTHARIQHSRWSMHTPPHTAAHQHTAHTQSWIFSVDPAASIAQKFFAIMCGVCAVGWMVLLGLTHTHTQHTRAHAYTHTNTYHSRTCLHTHTQSCMVSC